MTEERQGLLERVGFVWDVERGSVLIQQQRATVVGTPVGKRRRRKQKGEDRARMAAAVAAAGGTASTVDVVAEVMRSSGTYLL